MISFFFAAIFSLQNLVYLPAHHVVLTLATTVMAAYDFSTMSQLLGGIMVLYAPLFLCLRQDPVDSPGVGSAGLERGSQLDDTAVTGGAEASEAEGLLTAPEEKNGSPRKNSAEHSIYSRTGEV